MRRVFPNFNLKLQASFGTQGVLKETLEFGDQQQQSLPHHHHHHPLHHYPHHHHPHHRLHSSLTHTILPKTSFNNSIGRYGTH